MAQTNEGAVKAAVRKVLVKHGVYFGVIVPNGYGRAGLPDILACHKGLFIAIEVKSKHTRSYGVTALQARELEEIERAGGIALVIDEDGIEILDALLEARRDAEEIFASSHDFTRQLGWRLKTTMTKEETEEVEKVRKRNG